LRYENLTREQKEKLFNALHKEDIEKLAIEWNKKWRILYVWKAKLVQSEFKDEVLKDIIKSKKQVNITDVSNQFDISAAHIKSIIDACREEGDLIEVREDVVVKLNSMPSGEIVKIDIEPFFKGCIRFGVVSDTHLNSKYERLDVLNALYDIFEREGIKTVLHAGNIIEGYSRLNQFDVLNTGVDEQVKYLIKNYPRKKDIITHFITADDHEGWYVKQNHINIGKVIENESIEEGRNDLHHLGYIEADVEVDVGERPTIIRIMHPGGGSAYAKSYKPQKIIESFAGGEKPDFLIIGHYHKMIFDIERNVPYITAGCTADQSPFLRKTPIQVNVGGWIVELRIDDAGNVRRAKPEWFIFYNKDFYKEEIKKEYSKAWEYKW
jgi:predicted phosphodiesterase